MSAVVRPHCTRDQDGVIIITPTVISKGDFFFFFPFHINEFQVGTFIILQLQSLVNRNKYDFVLVL